MQPCHVILRYSLCQTKLHANVHFFSFLFQMWALWCLHASVEPLIEWDREKVSFFFSLVYFLVCFLSFFLSTFYSFFLFVFIFTSSLLLCRYNCPPLPFFHPEILLPKWRKKGCLGHFSPCSLVCYPPPGAFLFVIALFGPFSGCFWVACWVCCETQMDFDMFWSFGLLARQSSIYFLFHVFIF